MSLKDFQIISKLGEGAYSTVYKVCRLEDSHPYALKRVKVANLSSKQRENALNEIRILASIRHTNIVCYKEAFVDEVTKSLCIVMELANNRDLSYKISESQKKSEVISEQQIWDVFIQVVKGLNELHKLGIFHRDIKPANVFLNQDGTAKLGDLNVSKISEKGLCITQTGTPYYASPQVWKDKPYDEKSDIWSLGCVLYEMITLKPPFRGEDMEVLYKKVVRGIYSRIPSEFSNDLSMMVRLLLQINPEQRPSCEKILGLPIVIKRSKSVLSPSSETFEKTELLKTIKAASNFYTMMNDHLPKANYQPVKVRKSKGIKSLIDSIEEKEKQYNHQQAYSEPKESNTVGSNHTLQQTESLPTLALNREKKESLYQILGEETGSDRDRYAKDNSKGVASRVNEVNSLLPIDRERKKSEISKANIADLSSCRGGSIVGDSNSGLEINGVNCSNNLGAIINRYEASRSINNREDSNRVNQRELKLPRVGGNRYGGLNSGNKSNSKQKESRMYKQNSLRNHKIYE